jgi:ComF family protein
MKLLPYLKCPVCERPAIDGATHPKCRTEYTIDGLTSFFRYDGIVKKAIKKIKYRYVSDSVSELISCTPTSSFSILTKLLSSKPLSFFFVPIPLHPSRYRDRGFNQAEVIARALEKRLNIPVKKNVLIRTKKTTPQVEMKDQKKRLANMKDVFVVRESSTMKQPALPAGGLNNVTIILVDDVFTTGATLRSAASALKHSGVKFVWGLTIAQ